MKRSQRIAQPFLLWGVGAVLVGGISLGIHLVYVFERTRGRSPAPPMVLAVGEGVLVAVGVFVIVATLSLSRGRAWARTALEVLCWLCFGLSLSLEVLIAFDWLWRGSREWGWVTPMALLVAAIFLSILIACLRSGELRKSLS